MHCPKSHHRNLVNKICIFNLTTVAQGAWLKYYTDLRKTGYSAFPFSEKFKGVVLFHKSNLKTC